MSYIDNLSQGYQNTYGGGYTQMYRKQPQTQIGGSQIKAPMRISLDRMYGGMPTAPPGPPTAPTFPIDVPEDYVPSAGYDDYDQYLEDQGWTLRTDDTGVDFWLPPGERGDVYETSGGITYVYRGGEWREPLTGEYATDFVSDADFIEAVRLVGYGGMEGAEQFIESFITDTPSPESGLKGTIAELKEGMELAGIDEKRQKEIIRNLKRARDAHWLKQDPIETWQDQLESLMKQFEAGEIEYIDENGGLDITALRGMGNMMSDWLADVLETSFETGLIQSDFFDAEGNLIPELENMSLFFESDPQAMENWNRYNKELAMHAIAKGQSIESAYYSEAVAGAVVGYAAQVADQATQLLANEMKMQYEYIASSFQNILVEAGLQQQSEGFIAAMDRAYAEIQQKYEMGLEELAARISENEAANRGSIFSGIFSFIVNAALTLF